MGRIFLAAPLAPSDLDASLTQERDNLSWDNKQGCVVAQREKRIGKLLIEAQQLQSIDVEALSALICSAAARYGRSMFAWTEEVQALQRRIAQVAVWHPELNLPDVSTDHLLQTASSWLPFYLSQAARPMTSTAELRRLPLAEIVWNILPYDQQHR